LSPPPIDHHLIVEPGVLQVTKGPTENRFRPAIDPLFRSAAQVYGPAAIGVILTGSLDDGTSGLWTIKQLGGTTVVQDPKDALFPAMPLSALREVHVDYLEPLTRIPALLSRLVDAAPGAHPHDRMDTVDIELKIARGENAVDAGVLALGTPSVLSCPECHGVLLKMKERNPLRYRCHTGHALSVAT